MIGCIFKNKFQDNELLTKIFLLFLLFLDLVLKIYNGFPRSITGIHRKAQARQVSCSSYCPSNMYSEQPLGITVCLKSIMLINVIKTDGAHFELVDESASQ